MMRFFLFTLFFNVIGVVCVLSLSAPAENEIHLFVSPNGNDRWSGNLPEPNSTRTDGPFQTLYTALEKVKTLRSDPNTNTKTIRVFLRDGVYILDKPIELHPEHSGTADSKTILENFPGEKPVISGGRKVTNWIKDGERWVAEIPEVKQGLLNFSAMWVNGQRRQPARHPNPQHPFGDYPSEKELFIVKEYRYAKKTGSSPARLHIFYDESTEIPIINNLKQAYCVILCRWIAGIFKIQSMDTSGRMLDLVVPNNFVFFIQGPGDKFYLEHVYKGLDTPGEWYLDVEAGKLYYISLPEEDMTQAEVVVPTIPQLLIFKGVPEENRFVQHIEIKGIEFTYTNYPLWEQGRFDSQAEVSVPATIEAVGAQNCLIENCTIQRINNYAIWWRKGSQENIVRKCHLYDMGAGGVKIGETANAEYAEEVREIPPDEKDLYLYKELSYLDAGKNTVENCYIHEGGRAFRSAVGVWIGRSSYNRIAHNEISDFRYTGISVGWCWGYDPSSAHHNIVEYNHIHEIGKAQLNDMGGIYTLGISPGTVLRNNHIHHIICELGGYGGWGLYTDEGSSYIVLENNIVHHTLTGNFHQHYGKENKVYNNIFAFSANQQIIRSREEPHISFHFERNIVYFNNGQLLGGNWSNNKWTMDYNCYWDSSQKPIQFSNKSLESWRELGFDEDSIIADPLFVNAEEDDYRIQPNSPVLALGFKPIEVSNIGLYGDDSWVTLPKLYQPLRTPCPKEIFKPNQSQ